MAGDVWSIRGVTAHERETITKAAADAGLPIARFVVQACLALDADSPRPERIRQEALQELATLARIATETTGRDAASRLVRRMVAGWVQATGAVAGIPLLPATRRPRTIEGNAIREGKAA